MWAPFTNNLVRKYSTEEIFDYIFIASGLNLIFESVKENIGELIDIHLFENVGWLTLVVFECMTELSRNIVFGVAFQQGIKHFFDLVQYIFLTLLLLFKWIFAFKNSLPKIWDHKYLLEQTVHIADASKIFQSNIAACRFNFFTWS